jgi:L-alanine-DL-glutamate epimerase-like enolase superfamily enzyme
MRFMLKETRLGLRNSTTRIPFRYGAACLTRCPQAVLSATIDVDGKSHVGFSGDCLPPGWFDKATGKDYSEQIDDMLAVIALAEKTFLDEASYPVEFFPAWLAVYQEVHRRAAQRAWNGLLASFGVSMVERAVMDALARAAGLSFAQAVRQNIFAIQPEQVHAELAGLAPADWLPARPRDRIFVRHTVGLGDPITEADVPHDERLEDGFPQALEQYIQHAGLRYFKIKVSNNLDHDRQRLTAIAKVVEHHLGEDYKVTLDGNEQYKQAADFDALVEVLESDAALATLWRNTLAIEQPLDRAISLDPAHTAGIRRLASCKPVIIDEADVELASYPQALETGYRGVSTKNCKGPVKSLLNAGLTWLRNDRGRRQEYLMTGEDLCTVGVIPVQSDLCLVATLGLSHVERNGHHYHPGLSYLPKAEQEAALQSHGDLYARQHGRVAPLVRDGQFSIESLQCPGFGFAVAPQMDGLQSPQDWQFTSLGL